MIHVPIRRFVRRGSLVALGTLAALLYATPAPADLVGFDFSAVGVTSSNKPLMVNTVHAGQDFGFQFAPTTDIVVTGLLIWDYLGNDFAGFDGDVAIWSVASPGTPIVSGAITAAGSPVVASASVHGNWRLVEVPDTALSAGVAYHIGSDGFAELFDPFAGGVTPVPNNHIGLGNYYQSSGTSLGPDYPASPIPPGLPHLNIPTIYPVGAASFTYTVAAVPEASSIVLLGLVAAATAGAASIRRVAQAIARRKLEADSILE